MKYAAVALKPLPPGNEAGTHARRMTNARRRSRRNQLGSALGLTFIAAMVARLPVDARSSHATIPILFNDHHVYVQSDRLAHGRVLAALVRGGTVLVPLRAMFERTGAMVSYDSHSKTVDVAKPGADVRVTAGRAEVVVNGESRPLDVAPQMDHGTMLVPLRVISEGMGAYVQWVSERNIVVVRYVTAVPQPPPTPAPAAEPTQSPVPASSPIATTAVKPAARKERFVIGDYIDKPKVYNEFSPGSNGAGTSYSVRGAVEFSVLRLPLMIAADDRSYAYPHAAGLPAPGDPGNVTVIGGYGQTFVPAFNAREIEVSGRFALRVTDPRIYLGIAFLHREENYGYPTQNGVGFGLEKLPDLDRLFSLEASAYYYPSVSANYVYPRDAFTLAQGLSAKTGTFAYGIFAYRIGASIMLTKASRPLGIFIDGGFVGDALRGKSLAPSRVAEHGAYAGLGLKL